MANDFSGDSNCKALWRFEPEALDVDSIGSNTLTLVNSPACDELTPLEGAGSIICSVGSNSGAYIPDASLDAGFPLKTGDTTKLITVCGRIKPTSLQVSVIVGKFSNASGDSFLLVQNSNSWSLGWVSGGWGSWWQYIGSIAAGTEYHFGLVIDGTNKTAHLRIWDGASVNNYDNTFGGVIDVGGSNFLIGLATWGSAAFGGDVDEVVVFDRLLTDDEIDDIRQEIYTPSPPTFVEVVQAGIAIPYLPEPFLQINQGGIAVVYSDQALASYVEADAGGVGVVYMEETIVNYRKYPIPLQKRKWETQPGRRKFPVIP